MNTLAYTYNSVEFLINEYCKNFFKNTEKIFKTSEKKRLDFIQKFPISDITSIALDDYVVGKQSHDSFCYWLETELRSLGSIKGGAAADKKFGIYFSKASDSYIFLTKRWGTDLNIAYTSILNEISLLLEYGAKKDLNSISEIRLSPMFKNKILCTYYPDLYINIFAPEHVEHFLNKLNISFDDKISLEEKRELLVQFKNDNPLTCSWNNYIFAHFLYTSFNPKVVKETVNELEIEHCLNATDVNACYVEHMGLIKERKINQKIIKKLKNVYDGICQLCGNNPVATFDTSILEGHHIEYFSKSQNNNMDNIILVCPNCHSLIHKLNPTFDKENLCYKFSDGQEMVLMVNKHL